MQKKTNSYLEIAAIFEAEENKNKKIQKALNVSFKAEEKYSKLNPFARFFSHFVPDNWTEAGKLRQEIKSCNDAFKDANIEQKDIDQYYKDTWSILDQTPGDDTLYNEQKKELIKNSHMSKKSKAMALHKFAEENLMVEDLDLSSLVNVSDDEEEIEDEVEEVIVEETKEPPLSYDEANVNNEPTQITKGEMSI